MAWPPWRPWHGPARGSPPSGDAAQVHDVAGRQAASCGSVGGDADRERRQDFNGGQVSQVRAQACRPVDAARLPVLARPPMHWLQGRLHVCHTRMSGATRPCSKHWQQDSGVGGRAPPMRDGEGVLTSTRSQASGRSATAACATAPPAWAPLLGCAAAPGVRRRGRGAMSSSTPGVRRTTGAGAAAVTRRQSSAPRTQTGKAWPSCTTPTCAP